MTPTHLFRYSLMFDAMRFEVIRIKEGHTPLNWTGELTGLDLCFDGESPPEPIEFTGEVSRLGDLVTVRGTVVTELGRECDRCLGSATLKVSAEFLALIKILRRDETPETLQEDENDPLIPVAYDTAHVDLSGHVREAVLLALPMATYCKSDCLGLCPVCGADMNTEPCDCDRPTDARWAALEALK